MGLKKTSLSFHSDTNFDSHCTSVVVALTVSQATVAVSGKAKDLAATISSGKSAQEERETKQRAREEKEAAEKEQAWKEQQDREREKEKQKI